MVQELPVPPPPEEKVEVEVTRPASKLSIPTIVVEEEPAEPAQQAAQTKTAKGPVQKTRAKSRRTRPMSPELGQTFFSFSFCLFFV